MKFGLRIPLLHDPEAEDPFHRTYLLCQEAEAAGFDFVTLTHHSFTPECQTSAPFVTFAALAARTRKLRFATCIFLLPLHHPVAVAEQVASLDVISNGRAILGVGLGYRDYEFEGFGLSLKDRGARANESLTAIRGAWTTGRFNFQGKHFQIADLPAVPIPVQQPHPPIWVGGLSEPALNRAARLGDGWISDNMALLDDVATMAETYRTHCAEAGTRPFLVVPRNAGIGHTRAQVTREWFPSAAEFHLGYVKAYLESGLEITDPVYLKMLAGESVTVEEFTRDRAIAGTPEDCIRQIAAWRDRCGADAMLFLLNEELPVDGLVDTVRLFGREVFPTFTDQSRQSS